MLNSDLLKINKAAAKLLGYIYEESLEEKALVRKPFEVGICPIDIFTSAEDCQMVVKTLGLKHCIYLVPEFKHIGSELVPTGNWEADGKDDFFIQGQGTYEMAVGLSLLQLYSV